MQVSTCPFCRLNGLISHLKWYNLSFTECIEMCTKRECLFPMSTGKVRVVDRNKTHLVPLIMPITIPDVDQKEEMGGIVAQDLADNAEAVPEVTKKFESMKLEEINSRNQKEAAAAGTSGAAGTSAQAGRPTGRITLPAILMPEEPPRYEPVSGEALENLYKFLQDTDTEVLWEELNLDEDPDSDTDNEYSSIKNSFGK